MIRTYATIALGVMLYSLLFGFSFTTMLLLFGWVALWTINATLAFWVLDKLLTVLVHYVALPLWLGWQERRVRTA